MTDDEAVAAAIAAANEQTKQREIARLARLREVELPDMIDDAAGYDLDDLYDAARRAEEAGWRRACVAHDVDVGYYLVASRPKIVMRLIDRIRALERAAATGAPHTSVLAAGTRFAPLEDALREAFQAYGFNLITTDGVAVRLDADLDAYSVVFRPGQPNAEP